MLFYARCLAYDSFEYGGGDCLCGHDAEVSQQTVSAIEKAGLPTAYFPYTHELVDQNEEYRESIYDKAKDQDYSLITFDMAGDFIMF